jgi:hypothetical protein
MLTRLTVIKSIKHIFSSVDDAMANYQAKFQEFREAFGRESTLHTQITVLNIAKQLSELCEYARLEGKQKDSSSYQLRHLP